MSPATKVVGYVRVSSLAQAQTGLSLAEQRIRLQSYAVAMGLELISIEEDAGQSAKDMDRPGLQAALHALDSGEASGLLVVKLDRLTRSLRDLADLMERYFSRFSLMSLGDSIDTRTAGGRMVLNVLTTVSQWEREAGGERTKAALSLLKRQGKKLGSPFMKDSVPETVKLVKELYATGAYSMASLAEELNRRGVPTAKGGKWWPKTVHTAITQ